MGIVLVGGSGYCYKGAFIGLISVDIQYFKNKRSTLTLINAGLKNAFSGVFLAQRVMPSPARDG